MRLKSTTKRCSRCRRAKPPTDFNRCSRRADGLQAYCRDCQKAKFQEFYAKDRAGQVARSAAYVAKHPDRARADKARYYQRHKDRLIANSKRYALLNSEATRARNRSYYLQHREERIAYAGDYAKAHQEHVRRYKDKWQVSNPLKRREIKHRRRAREHAAFVGPVDYVAIRKRDNGICHICHNPVPRDRLHFDHVIPIAKGGAHSMANIKVAHARCNLKKGSR